ncbi:hypothetical protein [Celeribacter marinus]|uniref:hypothetical protein n=1 Tax=Celeribacter marinus TaxID=1397108 RepID=UPI00317F94AF
MTKRDRDRWGPSPLEAPLDPQTDQALDALFAQARDVARDADRGPSADLMARIMADADAQLADMTPAPRAHAPRHHPVVRAAMAALGGWRGLTGVATAGVTGLVIGLGAPGVVTNVALGSQSAAVSQAPVEVSAYALDDLVPSFYDLGTEG